jgi:AraC family transcriptional activator of pobA
MSTNQNYVTIDNEIENSFAIRAIQQHATLPVTVFRANYHRIFMIDEGSGSIGIDEVNYSIAGKSLLLIAKGQLFSFQQNATILGYEIVFGDCFWEKTPQSANNCKAVLFNNAEANQQIPLSDKDYTQLNPLFEDLYQEYLNEEYINKLDAMAAYLKIIMIKIANINALLTKGYDTYEKQLYRRFLELVSTQYQDTHEVADFANQLGIPARKLSDLCKRCSGKGAKDIINGQLIAEAKRSLQFSSNPIKEIAFHLNFSSPDQFSHFFKKNTQISPVDYRERFVKIAM